MDSPALTLGPPDALDKDMYEASRARRMAMSERPLQDSSEKVGVYPGTVNEKIIAVKSQQSVTRGMRRIANGWLVGIRIAESARRLS